VRIELEQIKSVLLNGVLKREVVESERIEEPRKRIQRAAGKLLRAKAAKQSTGSFDATQGSEITAKSVDAQPRS